MADLNDDSKKSDADGDAKKDAGKPDGDGKKDAGKKDDKSTKQEKTDDLIDPETERKFSQSEVNAMLKKQKAKLESEKGLSELELAKKEASEAKAELAKTRQRSKFQSALGLENESTASRLFNAYADDLEFDENGNVTNLKEIKELAKKDFPNLFSAKAKGDIDAGGNPANKKDQGGSMNDLIRRKAGRV